VTPLPPNNSPVLKVRGLGKTYPNGTRALADVSLDVQAGELIAIIGRSGAGKSTLLRCLNRLLRPTEGRIDLHGLDVTAVSGAKLRRVRQHVGMIFQQFNVVGRLTVLDNVLAGRLRYQQPQGGSRERLPRWLKPARWAWRWVLYAASLARWMRPAEREAAFGYLQQVGIASIAWQRADTLSGGQLQRVAIARVLAQNPEVILADEPIASLDPRSADQVMRTLQVIQQERGIPVLVNLHQVEVALRYATRIVGMADGRVVFDERADKLDEIMLQRVYDESSSEHPAGASGGDGAAQGNDAATDDTARDSTAGDGSEWSEGKQDDAARGDSEAGETERQGYATAAESAEDRGGKHGPAARGGTSG
jgi:phosphonate transport system ATP-binding protein